jgi:hypothetical protein
MRWKGMTRLSYYNLAPDGNENPRLDLPGHAATLIEHDKDRGGRGKINKRIK